MSKVRALVLLTVILGVAFGSAMAKDTPFLVTDGTTSQVAVLAPFIAFDQAAGLTTSISVSNILGAPDDIMAGLNDKEGTIEFYIFRADGEQFEFETSNNELGNKVLTDDGKLGPGKTFACFVEEILNAANAMPENGTFVGYMWVVLNADAVTGTVNVFFPDFGFAQSFNMEPTFGGINFAGLPVMGVE